MKKQQKKKNPVILGECDSCHHAVFDCEEYEYKGEFIWHKYCFDSLEEGLVDYDEDLIKDG